MRAICVLYYVLMYDVLRIHILTHALLSPPLLIFGARPSGCGRLHACSSPLGAHSVHHLQHVSVYVINIITTSFHYHQGREHGISGGWCE
jgi:hypothetical protein